eukprot:scaffold84679_cov15-Tisochrysis_lutea.AAC.1
MAKGKQGKRTDWGNKTSSGAQLSLLMHWHSLTHIPSAQPPRLTQFQTLHWSCHLNLPIVRQSLAHSNQHTPAPGATTLTHSAAELGVLQPTHASTWGITQQQRQLPTHRKQRLLSCQRTLCVCAR